MGKGESFLLVLLVVSSDRGGGVAFLTGEYGNGLTGAMALGRPQDGGEAHADTPLPPWLLLQVCLDYSVSIDHQFTYISSMGNVRI
jgi:hypothetical protein